MPLEYLDGYSSIRSTQTPESTIYDSERKLSNPLQEEMMDIAGILSGLAHTETEFERFNIKLHEYHSGLTEANYTLPNGVHIAFHDGEHSKGRHFTVTVPSSSITLRFRFTGHHNVQDNFEGISSFFHPSFMGEFMCELQPQRQIPDLCPPLHALVVNSGQHDLASNIKPPGVDVTAWFDTYLVSLLALLAPHQAAAIANLDASHRRSTASASTATGAYSVIWRGNTLATPERVEIALVGLDKIARSRVQAVGIPFVDVAAIVSSIPDFPACCTTTKAHFGVQEFHHYISTHGVRNNFTASSLVTNAILRKVCPLPRN